jgi:hypothetical protein
MAYIFINQLYELTNKTVCREYLDYVWKKQFDWNDDKTKSWLLDNLNELKEIECKWKEKRNYRRNIAEKYMINDSVPKDIKPYDSKNITSKIRYIDGKIVSNKGEKYVIKKVGEE